ncbi:histone deacetylase HDAC2, partial [Toxoplasma gondii ARI]
VTAKQCGTSAVKTSLHCFSAAGATRSGMSLGVGRRRQATFLASLSIPTSRKRASTSATTAPTRHCMYARPTWKIEMKTATFNMS